LWCVFEFVVLSKNCPEGEKNWKRHFLYDRRNVEHAYFRSIARQEDLVGTGEGPFRIHDPVDSPESTETRPRSAPLRIFSIEPGSGPHSEFVRGLPPLAA